MKTLNGLFDGKTAKFLVVGALNTLVGSVVMFGLYNVFQVSYWLSSASNYMIGSLFSYILNKNWTFKDKDSSQNKVPLFIVNILVCYLLAYGIAKPVTALLLRDAPAGMRDNLSMGMGIVLFTLFNYIGQRYVVFRSLQTEAR